MKSHEPNVRTETTYKNLTCQISLYFEASYIDAEYNFIGPYYTFIALYYLSPAKFLYAILVRLLGSYDFNFFQFYFWTKISILRTWRLLFTFSKKKKIRRDSLWSEYKNFDFELHRNLYIILINYCLRTMFCFWFSCAILMAKLRFKIAVLEP